MAHVDPHDRDETGATSENHEAIDAEPLEPLRRTQHGTLGTVIGAAMLGLDQVLGRKPREDAPIVVTASGEPGDIDIEGIIIPLDEHSDLVAPPLPVAPMVVAPSRRPRWR